MTLRKNGSFPKFLTIPSMGLPLQSLKHHRQSYFRIHLGLLFEKYQKFNKGSNVITEISLTRSLYLNSDER